MENRPNIDILKEQLAELQQKMSAYNHALSLLSFDGATIAPRGTTSNRARTLGVLSGESYKLSTGEETIALLEALDDRRDELTAREQRQVEMLLKDIRRMQKIPFDEYVAYQELLAEADDIWHTAKENSDFALFEPYLEKIVATVRRIAQLCAPEKDPYDYWLNEYEEGLSAEKCDAFFATVRARLVPLLKKVASVPQVDDACVKGVFTDQQQEAFSRFLMEQMGLDMDHVTLATTEHPFTTSLGSHLDERITTHYISDDLSSSMFSVIHEGGHALYDTGSDDELAYTVLDGGVSMSIHESQSRFYENVIGRSRAFADFITPVLHRFFPETAAYTGADFFRAFNRVQPSLIRTEADEVTYCLHIMVRYELERALMSGKLKVHDLPEAWNRMYKEYLGVDVPSDRQGVLQDVHWSGGMFGYFPSYALGSAYAAQYLQKMKNSFDVEGDILKGDFTRVNAWNREHIWHFGSEKTPETLLKNAVGAFDPDIYLQYLENKCRDVYGI